MIGELWPIFIEGTISGGSLALLALGLTLLYGVARIINLAHGSLYLLCLYAYYAVSVAYLKLDPLVSFVVALFITGFLGIILYRVTIHPILGDDVAVLIVTITSAVAIQQIVILLFGGWSVPLINPFGVETIYVLGVRIRFALLITFFVSLLLFLITAFFVNKTKIGKAMRALSQDREAAMLMGVNATNLFTFCMALSAILAGVAGLMHVVPFGSVQPHYWYGPLTSAFAVVVLGGLGSIKGSLLGSFIISYSEEIVREMVPNGVLISHVVALAVLVVVILIRPKGLFGKRVEMED